MSEHKYTDEEVIKALECHADERNACSRCPISNEGCSLEMSRLAIDLINRQKAEIERLTAEKDTLIKTYKECMVEAIKEFAEKLKKRECSNAFCAWCAHADIYGHRAKECDEPYVDKDGKEQKACYAYAKFESYIDALVKEFTEEKEWKNITQKN